MTVVTLVSMETRHQRTPDQIAAMYRLIWESAMPELKAPTATWEHEGQEFTRLDEISSVLAWALGKSDHAVDSPAARSAFAWLSGGLAPVGEDGHTPGYRRRVA